MPVQLLWCARLRDAINFTWVLSGGGNGSGLRELVRVSGIKRLKLNFRQILVSDGNIMEKRGTNGDKYTSLLCHLPLPPYPPPTPTAERLVFAKSSSNFRVNQ